MCVWLNAWCTWCSAFNLETEISLHCIGVELTWNNWNQNYYLFALWSICQQIEWCWRNSVDTLTECALFKWRISMLANFIYLTRCLFWFVIIYLEPLLSFIHSSIFSIYSRTLACFYWDQLILLKYTSFISPFFNSSIFNLLWIVDFSCLTVSPFSGANLTT